jgi:hypothetical protein
LTPHCFAGASLAQKFCATVIVKLFTSLHMLIVKNLTTNVEKNWKLRHTPADGRWLVGLTSFQPSIMRSLAAAAAPSLLLGLLP